MPRAVSKAVHSASVLEFSMYRRGPPFGVQAAAAQGYADPGRVDASYDDLEELTETIGEFNQNVMTEMR